MRLWPRKQPKEKKPWDDICPWCFQIMTEPNHTPVCIGFHRKEAAQRERQEIINKLDQLYEERTYCK